MHSAVFFVPKNIYSGQMSDIKKTATDSHSLPTRYHFF